MTNEQKLLERTRELAAKLVDGELAAEEAEELTQLLQDGDDRLGVLADHLLLDCLLSEELGKSSLTALVDIVSDNSLDAETSSTYSPVPVAFTSIVNQYWKPAGWVIAATLAGLMAIILFRGDATAFANAATIVQAAKESHAEVVERVYVVQVETEAAVDADFSPPRDVRVATQGDRFYVEMNRGERRWFWGRDTNGATWMTLGPRRALRIDADETGPALAYINDLYSLNLESVLDNALKHCEIETTSASGQVYVVKATPKRANGWLRAMTIEVDKETKAVRKLVLQRHTPRQGDATVTFTLVDARIPDESKYRAEGHLVEPFQIFSRDHQSEKRRDVLKSWFGIAADRWITTEGKKSHEK